MNFANLARSKSTSERIRHWVGPRGRLILRTSGWSIIAKLAAATNLFLAVPFVLHALGPSQFGAWATLVSLIYFTGFLDFGFGNGTMNLVAEAQGRGETEDIGHIIRAGQKALLRVSLCLLALGLIAIPLVPWSRLLGLSPAMDGDSRMAAAALLITVAVAVPLNLANRVQLGLGCGHQAFRWQAAGQLLALIAVISAALLHASLGIMTIAAVSTPLLASALNTIALSRNPILVINKPISAVERNIKIKRIQSDGLLFFLLQITAAVAYSSDLPLISALTGSIAAGNYAIAQRLFSIVPQGLSLVWAPLWPVYRHALSSGDHAWLIKTFRYSIIFAAIFSAVAAVSMAYGFSDLSQAWVHRRIEIQNLLLWGFAGWCFVDAIGTALGTFLNAAGILRYQLMFSPLFAIVSLIAKVIALKSAQISVLPLITAISYILLVLLPISTRYKSIRSIIQTGGR